MKISILPDHSIRISCLIGKSTMTTDYIYVVLSMAI
jgi:hypothetical protein